MQGDPGLGRAWRETWDFLPPSERFSEYDEAQNEGQHLLMQGEFIYE
jgi:hypothetical protein